MKHPIRSQLGHYRIQRGRGKRVREASTPSTLWLHLLHPQVPKEASDLQTSAMPVCELVHFKFCGLVLIGNSMGTWNFVEGEGILLAQLEFSLDSTQDTVITHWFEAKGLMTRLQEQASPHCTTSPPPWHSHWTHSDPNLCVPSLAFPTLVGKRKPTMKAKELDSAGKLDGPLCSMN